LKIVSFRFWGSSIYIIVEIRGVPYYTDLARMLLNFGVHAMIYTIISTGMIKKKLVIITDSQAKKKLKPKF
jgi:hypothetical protein